MQQTRSVAEVLGGRLVEAHRVDVGAARERARQRRLRVLAVVLGIPAALLWWRILSGDPANLLALPPMPEDPIIYVIPLMFVLALGVLVALPLASGRSPHVMFRPEQLEVTFDDVIGLEPLVDEVTKSLNTFLGYALYRDRLGGSPRRGLLFEGPPGTGKTHLAKAMARHAGVPFLFVSATSFQSMWYGATARKIRSFFRQLRKVARREGGAIGFIEEIDAIGGARRGLSSVPHGGTAACAGPGSTCCAPAAAAAAADAPAPGSVAAGGALPGGATVQRFTSEGAGGVVNELLVQMQSFDVPPFGTRLRNALAGALNAFLPAHRQIRKSPPGYANILLVAATNRADSLDPALLRPGRFDRRLSFERPAKAARRELVDHFLARKTHASELDDDRLRDALAGQTLGYTPVMIEHLLDEALVVALRNGRDGMSWADVQEARLTQEVGLKNPVAYTDHERQVVATHEAAHATMAHLAGTRTLEVLSIVKRSSALGLLAHRDSEEVYTRSRTDLRNLIEIALAGHVAEELWFGEVSTGPASDLAYATRIACEYIGSAGMGDSLVSLAAVQSGSLNSTNLVGRVLSDRTARPEVERELAEARARVHDALERHSALVEALRDALLAREELIGDEITRVLETAQDRGEGEPSVVSLPADPVGVRGAAGAGGGG